MIERLVIYGLNETYTDLYERYGLIISNKALPAPEAKTRFVELPGSDIPADISGGRYFGRRTATLNLTKPLTGNTRAWLRNLISELHGKVFTFAFLSAPTRQFTGRFVLGDWDENGALGTISLTINIASETAVTEPSWVDDLTSETRAEENASNVERDKATDERAKQLAYEAQRWLDDIIDELTLTRKFSAAAVTGGSGNNPAETIEISTPWNIGQIHIPAATSGPDGAYLLRVKAHYGGWVPAFVPFRKTRKSDGKLFYYHFDLANTTYKWGYWEALDGSERHAPDENAYYYQLLTNQRGVSDIDFANGIYPGWEQSPDEIIYGDNGNLMGSVDLIRANETRRINLSQIGSAYPVAIGPLRWAESNLSRSQIVGVWGDIYPAGAGFFQAAFDGRFSGMPSAPCDWWMILGFSNSAYEDYVFRIGELVQRDAMRGNGLATKPGYLFRGGANAPIQCGRGMSEYIVIPGGEHVRQYTSNGDYPYWNYVEKSAVLFFQAPDDADFRPAFEFVQATRLSDGKIFKGQDAIDAGYNDACIWLRSNEIYGPLNPEHGWQRGAGQHNTIMSEFVADQKAGDSYRLVALPAGEIGAIRFDLFPRAPQGTTPTYPSNFGDSIWFGGHANFEWCDAVYRVRDARDL